MSTSTIPASVRQKLDDAGNEIVDWLEANGISEWIPEDCRIVVGNGRLTYSSFVWQEGHERGWNGNIKTYGDDKVSTEPFKDGPDPYAPMLEPRTMPLKAPVTARIRECFAKSTLLLEEID